MMVLSFAAYAAWIALAALVFRHVFLPGTGDVSGKTSWPLCGTIAACCAGGAFFFVPSGSLPPFFNYSWGGGAFVGCLALSAVAEKDREGCIALLPPGCVAVVFFWYAYQRGMPGNAINLGTFVGMPVWGIASSWHSCGFLLLAVGFLLFVRKRFLGGIRISFAATLRHLALCALFVSFFVPWNTAPYLRLSDAVVAGCDFLLFWAKVLCLAVLLRRYAAPRAGGRFVALVSCVVGAVLVFCFF